MTKIAVFGSAFNPPSLGHLSVIQSLSHFDQVLLVPSIAHAWGKVMLDYSVRLELLNAFIADANLGNVASCNIEEALYQQDSQSVTTFAVLSALSDAYPEAELTFVMGPDNLFNFAKFYKAQQIAQRWTLMACPEKVAIRSTDIRNALQNNDSIKSLTTPTVADLLTKNNYYQDCQ